MEYKGFIGKNYIPNRHLRSYITSYNIKIWPEWWEQRMQLKTIPFGMAGILILLDEGKLHFVSEKRRMIEIKKAVIIGFNPLHHDQFMLPGGLVKRGLSISLTQLGVNYLLKLPLRELHKQVIDLELVLGHQVNDLIEVLENSDSETEMVSGLDLFFLGLLRSERFINQPFLGRINHILSLSQQMINVNELADHLNLHERSLQRRLREETGLTPKELLRLLRFIRILNLLTQDPYINIQDLIWRCGFYDQAHFCNEFQKITSYSPGNFYRMFRSGK